MAASERERTPGPRRSPLRLAAAAALAGLIAPAAQAQDGRAGCALVGGVLPPGCEPANAGQVVRREVGANVEDDAPSSLGDLGFAISIDPVDRGGPRRRIAGEALAYGDERDVDRLFEALGIQVSFDGLGARPMLNVSTADLGRSYAAGDTVTFRTYTNYPAWIDRAEIRIRDRAGRVTLVPVAPNGSAEWTMPAEGEAAMTYSLRVYDRAGRYDETVALPLDRSARRFADPELDGPVFAAGEAEDRTARRGIPVRGGAVTVTGRDVPAGTEITVMGEPVILDLRRAFVVQRILPPGDHGVRIGVGSLSATRDVSIPRREFFATGMIDVTLGRDFASGEDWRRGRVAGFLQGVFANGTRLTASVDTAEGDLSDIFSDIARKNPDRVLAGIRDEDVWVTTGDDSRSEDLAPTSGKLFLKLERDGSVLLWGDYKPGGELSGLVRSDRMLYGAFARWQSPGVTAAGEPRARVTVYAAQPETLVQRDIFRGTGGSAYFLSRRDIEDGSETLVVETRDPVSGRVVSARRLVEGQDYRIDYVQGLVILNVPLSPSAGAGGLVSDRPLGDYDVNLVVQYEYVPTTGDVDGMAAGGRAEAWVGETLRFGVSAARDGSGPADTTMIGADLLWRRSEGTYLRFDAARSEGPGFGSRLSLNGGLDFDPLAPSPGTSGNPALGFRVEGRVDLADIGGEGYVLGWYDDREAGFTSPDLDAEVARTAWGLEGEARVAPATRLTFGAKGYEDDDGLVRRDARLGAVQELGPAWQVGVEVARTERRNPAGTGEDDNGDRTDLGVKLTWTRDEDLSVWVFGQGTIDRSGNLRRNDRLGAGVSARLGEALTFSGEVSGGSRGAAGRAELAWSPNASSTYTLGYRLDPDRFDDGTAETGTEGADGGVLVFGAQSQISPQWRYTAEHSFGLSGSDSSQLAAYGVSYTPSDTWRFDLGLLYGQTRETDGTALDRRGLSFGARYAGGEAFTAGLRGEFRTEDSDNPTRALDRETLLFSGFVERRTSEDWHLVGRVDAVLSEADGDNLRDGRYVEAKLGFAYRPVDNDRLNALVSYTFLYDMPGADQVNVDGDVNGPRQRSHIVNAALSYDLSRQFTLGLKYGFRHREQAPRGSGSFTSSIAHLGIVRLDYHVVHKWDILGEVRAMHFPDSGSTDYGALVGVYRDVGDNLRLGAGYSWGGVSDDLRSIETNREGLFVNLIGKF